MIRFLLDENVPLASARRLRQLGHDIDLAPQGSSDEALVDRARATRRTLVTLDADFGFLLIRAARPAPPAVVFLRGFPPSPLAVADALIQVLTSPEIVFEGKLTVIEPGRVRQRPLART